MPTQEQKTLDRNNKLYEELQDIDNIPSFLLIKFSEVFQRLEALESLQQSLQPRTVAETVQVIKDATARASASPEAAEKFLQDAGIGQSNSPGRTSNPDAGILEDVDKLFDLFSVGYDLKEDYSPDEIAYDAFVAGRKSSTPDLDFRKFCADEGISSEAWEWFDLVKRAFYRRSRNK